MLFTGLACFGAAIAQGLLASRTPGPIGSSLGPSHARGLAIILLAFVEGIAFLGVVVGFLVIVYCAVSAPTDGLLAAGPAIVGAIIGVELIVLRLGSADRGVAQIGAAFIIRIALLSVVVPLLLATTGQAIAISVSDPPFVVLGALSGTAALGIGVSGARALGSLATATDQAAITIRASQIARCMPLQGVSIIATVIAILLLRLH
jgi:F0F1-type ATP synthase membrane subunit c/vacuolar-type H+-ATPase subunit K